MTQFRRRHVRTAAAMLLAAVFTAAPVSLADITPTGDVSPANPATWTTDTTAYVGNATDGALTVSAGSAVTSYTAYFGYQSTAHGAATVTGANSNWGGNGTFYVGYDGTGSLTLADGAHADAAAYLGLNPGSAGTAVLAGAGTLWNAGLYVGYDGAGSLRVSDGAALLDYGYLALDPGSTASVTVDGPNTVWAQADDLYVGYSGAASLAITHAAKVIVNQFGYSAIAFQPGSTASVTVDGPGSLWGNGGILEIGSQGNGSMTVTNGAKVTSDFAFIATDAGSTGSVAVDGPGSTWDDSTGQLDVGQDGRGSLRVTRGASVVSQYGYVGENTTGSVLVDGTGSSWTATDELYLSFEDGETGLLTISNGGHVSTAFFTLGSSSSVLSISVGDGSSLDVGSGGLSNAGTIRLTAAPNATPGAAYHPISAPANSAFGTVQALGGTWNSATQTFTASPLATTPANSPVTIDLTQTQRIAITDPADGQNHTAVFADFPAAPTSTSLTLTASPLTPDQSASLELTLPQTQTLLTGWSFDLTNYTQGTPVYLSLFIGPDEPAEQLQVWHYDGSAWTLYAPSDLTYDGNYASFTVTGFSAYAVTVPEPAGLTTLVMAAFAAVPLRRRRRHLN